MKRITLILICLAILLATTLSVYFGKQIYDDFQSKQTTEEGGFELKIK